MSCCSGCDRNLFSYAQDVDAPRFGETVGGEGPVEGVVGMCRNIDFTVLDTHHHGGVIEVVCGGAKLHNIANFKFFKADFLGKGPDSVVIHEKVIEVFHARPGRRSVVYRNIVPSERRSIVHNACTGIDTLRGKVGAVTAYIIEIIELRVAFKRPFLCVFVSFLSVIIKNIHTFNVLNT